MQNGIKLLTESKIVKVLSFAARESWHNLGDLAQQSAMEKYIAIVDQVDPGWDSEPLDQTKIAQVHNTVSPVRWYLFTW